MTALPESLLARIPRVHARLAPAILVIPSLVYLVTWDIEPYLYGFSVLGLGTLQVVWFLADLAFAALRVPRVRARTTFLITCAGVLSAVVAFAFLKSINWA